MSHFVFADVRRTQATLFGVDRLRAMRGANAMLARLLDVEFRKIVRVDAHELPEPSLVFEEDPAGDDANDRPRERFRDGVLTAAAGRFLAIVRDGKAAARVRKELLLVARTLMPDLRLDVRIGPVQNDVPLHEQCAEGALQPDAPAWMPLDAPYFVRDRHDGQSPALRRGDDDDTGYASALLFDESRSEDNPSARTFAALHEHLPEAWRRKRVPHDFHEIVDGREGERLAAVAVDGNGIGAAFLRWKGEACDDGPVVGAMVEEWFWWRLRCAMRAAVAAALRHAHERQLGLSADREHRPYQLLWLGGDDLSVAIDARLAFDFALELCRVFEAETAKIGPGRLTLGVGIAIVKPTFPFHEARTLAEDLVDSAKTVPGVSAIDWHVLTTSSVRSLAEQRREEWLFVDGAERYLLTQRPYPAVTRASGRPSLASLVDAARGTGTDPDGRARGRNRLKRMRAYLREHPRIAQWMAEDLFSPAERRLWGGDELLPAVPSDPTLRWTSVLDVGELTELCRTEDGDEEEAA